MHSGAEKFADHVSEQLIFVGQQVLRDVTQNVAFAAVILDKDRAKEQVFPGVDDRDFVVGIPQHDRLSGQGCRAERSRQAAGRTILGFQTV